MFSNNNTNTSSSSSSRGGDGFPGLGGMAAGNDAHVENSDAVQVLREREAQQDRERQAKSNTNDRLEGRIKAWEQKDGVQRNIRTLLSSLDSILWPNSGWQKVNLADLMDMKDIKKKYRKVRLSVSNFSRVHW